MPRSAFTAAVGAVTLCRALAGPAQALNTRTWISGSGVDNASCGPIATPCRTLQWAHDNTSPDGEIDVKDSAGYGAVTITKAIAIVGDGSLAGVLAPAGGDAITVNAPAGSKVILRGLAIEGAGSGNNGIVVNTVGVLDIANCVIQNFYGAATASGILIPPSGGTVTVSVVNTLLSHINYVGIYYLPKNGSLGANISVDRTTMVSVNYGFSANNSAAPTSVVKAHISNSSISHTSNEPIYWYTPGGKLTIDNCEIVDGGQHGVTFIGGTGVITRSTLENNNGYGLNIVGGTFSSFGDNRFFGNASGDKSGTVGTITLK